jgi:hypothetical protein
MEAGNGFNRMMDRKHTQEEIIMNVVSHSADPVPSWNLQKVNTPWGWLGHSADRMARKMAEQGKLHKNYVRKYVYYSLPKQAQQPKLFKEV